MRDPLRQLFTRDVLDRLAYRSRPEPSKWDTAAKPIRERHLVLATTGLES